LDLCGSDYSDVWHQLHSCWRFYITKDILKNMGNQTVDGAPLTSRIWGNTIEVNGVHQLFGSDILLNVKGKKLIHFLNNLRMS